MGFFYREKSGGPWKELPMIRGKSAYEAAVEGGYKGTEEDFNKAMSDLGSASFEDWTFTLADGSTVTKAVCVK